MVLVTIFQQIDIEEKLKNAPNDDYGTGILIGNLIPFIILVAIAYLVYYYNKKRANKICSLFV